MEWRSYKIKRASKVFVPRFNLRGLKIEFKINTKTSDTVNDIDYFKSAIKDVVQFLTSDADEDDYIGLTFCGKDYDTPGYLPFKKLKDIKWGDIFSLIALIYQSNSEGMSTEDFCMEATIVNVPKGSGKKGSKKFDSFSEECVKKTYSFIVIKNNDNLCLPRALVVGRAYVDNDPHFVKKKNSEKEQIKCTLELIQAANVNIPEHGCSIQELEQFQQYLNDYQIVVYQYSDNHKKEVIFKGVQEKEKRINLIHHNNHFNVIKSLTGAFACGYYCKLCETPYNTKNTHMCKKRCFLCQKLPPCKVEQNKIYCDKCNRQFRGKECFASHILVPEKGLSICEKIKKCGKCFKTITKTDKNNHTCDEFYCNVCKETVPPEHLCYMKKDDSQPRLSNILYVFFDLETQQDKVVGEKTFKQEVIGNVFEHVPNLCVFNTRCDVCINEINLYFCSKCKFRQTILKEDVIKKFVEYLLDARKSFKNIIVIAHNSQGFDSQFILRYFIKCTDHIPKLIMRGTKIVLMMYENIKFIDSLNFFPMPLSKLPQAFNLSVKEKGFYPHFFNTVENTGYEGPVPDMKYYSPDTMSEKDRSKFLEWYEERKKLPFNLENETVEYCVNDVNILSEACLKFRNLILAQSNVEPFLESVTLPGACNLVFRRNFLVPNTIGIIPPKGYRKVDTHSNKSLHWLLYEEKKRSKQIQSAGRGKEVVLNGMRVDGFISDTLEVFEFQGCYWHGCPRCFKTRRDESLRNDLSDTLNYRYERTQYKIARLKEMKYIVHEMYECEFSKLLETCPELKALENHPMLKKTPLVPRDAFYGGRTGCTRSYYKCKDENEKIQYIDVCSLYPWVCKTCTFPIGHPKIYVGEECNQLDLNQVEGLIKCKILPPQKLYHPVLPIKQNNKLMFSLCFSCSANNSQDEFCTHSDEERALSGTWVITEVRKALEKNYIMMEIYEIWSYKVVKYDPVNNVKGLFSEMMNEFIKIKTEASGFPSNCESEEEKQEYINDFLKYEKIQLDYNKIEKNPGLRSVAKLLLNSFWGKFGQQENMTQTEITQKPEVLYSLLTNPSVEVKQILPIDENNIAVHWQHINDAVSPLSTVNVCIAAFVTAHARLKLYSYLEKLDQAVLYYDTDSVIYIDHKNSEYVPSIGQFVGDMTNELEEYGKGSFITEFVCGGPKNYAYKVYSTAKNMYKTVCKVKGIRLNYETSQQINFDNIKKLILNDSNDNYINIKYNNIRRLADHTVVTEPSIKIYKPVLLKRKFLDDFSSVPFGYKRSRDN